jgi:hypothetical protein
VLGIVQGSVSAGVHPVYYGLHAVLAEHVVVTEQSIDGLFVHMATLVAVDQNLGLEQKLVCGENYGPFLVNVIKY